MQVLNAVLLLFRDGYISSTMLDSTINQQTQRCKRGNARAIGNFFVFIIRVAPFVCPNVCRLDLKSWLTLSCRCLSLNYLVNGAPVKMTFLDRSPLQLLLRLPVSSWIRSSAHDWSGIVVNAKHHKVYWRSNCWGCWETTGCNIEGLNACSFR
ncbi:uncharacterized protein LY79DRAFT_158169 [Colletotrichum navitas]|uniref:Uncharacterized protein n=1 Tax=Colletotrichum navitas TaxID=681940 RepID=A0AAD8Q2V2_9PEZI|nr:uncharacterized protein LY79DRAFT_158169 [Colletotrichum navitas]KAK1594478.1 hypothetical protein LY79DRAFT_158169 [Colletotrichum navitas]